MAIVLAPHSDAPIDTARVVEMLLVHDLVEIDAGDTFAYDDVGALTQDRARGSGGRPHRSRCSRATQASELRALWDEFEAGTSAEARFAHAVDRLAPLLLNHANGGALWREHALTADRVRALQRGHRRRIDRRSGPRSKAASTTPNDRAGSNRTDDCRVIVTVREAAGMKIGVSLRSGYAPMDARDRRAVDGRTSARGRGDAGLDSLFVGDHHNVPVPYYQNVPMLGRLLAEWDDRPAGALFLLPLWHPVLLAEQIGTLASIAAGPFIMQCAVGGGARAVRRVRRRRCASDRVARSKPRSTSCAGCARAKR